MTSQTGTKELDVFLDIFGQQPRLNIHTQISLCFALPSGVTPAAVVAKLASGLERLTASFSWIAGQVVSEGAGEGHSGVFKIKPSERLPRLVVKDLTDDPTAPTMQALRASHFPMRLLDEVTFAPRTTFPSPDDSAAPAPVFLFQASFIKDGLVLTFLGQHQAMDGVGQGHVMHLLSKACHDVPFGSDELTNGNLDRRNIIPLIENYQPGPELDYHRAKTRQSNTTFQTDPRSSPAATARCVWASFVFSPSSLSSLKSAASKTLPPGASFISTDDALSAMVWQSVMRARQPRLPPHASATFARAIDMRRYLAIPPTYPGMIQSMAYRTYQLQVLLNLPLGGVASALRTTIDPNTTDLPFRTRALATYLSHQADKSLVSPSSMLDLSIDLMLSSWANMPCYSLDFALGLGAPEAVRRPRFAPVESLAYLLPRAIDGEIALALCLREEDMDRLRADEEFGRFARFDG